MTVTIFLRGVTQTGKTTIAKVLAKKFAKSVIICQDSIRNLIENGLVVSKTDLHPGDYTEYVKQIRLADRNIFSLIRNFTSEGFTCIIDGFDGNESGQVFEHLKDPENIKWYPTIEVVKQELPNITRLHIALDVNTEIFTKRLRNITFDKEVINFIMKERHIFRNSSKDSPVKLILDTSNAHPDQLVQEIINLLNGSS